MNKIIFAILLFTGCIIFITCKKADIVQPAAPPTLPAKLIANAGSDQVLYLPTNHALLYGSGSSGNIISYSWAKISGPNTFNIENTSAKETVINNLVQGVYQFELTVKDSSGTSTKDTMQLTVYAPIPPPPPPQNPGTVSFWILNADDDYYGYGYISINNETKVSNCYWNDTGPSDCSDPCTTRFNLPPGNYSWKAWTGYGDTLRGNLTLAASNSCMLQKIDF